MNSYTDDNNQASEMQQNLELFQELPFFAAFPMQAMKLLALVAERSHFAEQEIVLEAGDDHGRAYLILQGQLTLIKENPETTIHDYFEGDFIGIFSLFGPMVSLFTLKAVTPANVLCIEREHFSKILQQFPETAQLSLKALTREIHQWERKNLTSSSECCLRLTGVTNL